MGFSEASRAFHVNVHTIIMRSRRDHWPTSSRVEERARLLQASLQRQSEAAQERRNGNDQALEAAAESWAQKAERHRALAFDFAHGALRTASKAPPPIESWRDIDLIDRCARRNAGLDDSERNQTINIGMQMVEARLLSLELPRDALPGMPGCESGAARGLIQDASNPLLGSPAD
jgi:hypothetical protein